MSEDIVGCLERWKTAYGSGADASELERLLETAASKPVHDPASLIRLHEVVLFLRTYPPTPAVAQLADAILAGFAARVEAARDAGQELAPFEEPEVSGIAGTAFTAIFSYEVARQLVVLEGAALEIDWDAYAEPERLGPVLALLVESSNEDWQVEAHPQCRAWLEAAVPRGSSAARWLLERMVTMSVTPAERAALYQSLALPLRWNMAAGPGATRTLLRLPQASALFCHTEPLIRRSQVSIETELAGPPIPIGGLDSQVAKDVLRSILVTSATRYRELHGFSHPNERDVRRAILGRGVEMFFFGVARPLRLPLRAYHAGMLVKNGVPMAYVEALSLADHVETGFNLYYTFRDGESAWLYARTLHLLHQELGVNCFSVDPYQLGHENPEAIQSGAFWFYRKLGFRPVVDEIRELMEREEQRMAQQPRYRSPRTVLARLAEGCLVYEAPGALPGFWNGFSARTLGTRLERMATEAASAGMPGRRPLASLVVWLAERDGWTVRERAAADSVMNAKIADRDEYRFLRLMQKHLRLRAGIRELGTAPG